MNTGIQKTKDYSLFKTIVGNRALNNQYLGRLTLAIVKNNMLHVNPIIVNEKMQVIDGQHRLEVARNNNLEIYYLVLPDSSIDAVMELNENLKPWVGKDYIQSYAIQGNKQYQWLQNFLEEYSFSPTQARLVIWGNEGGGNTTKLLKSGRLKLTEAQQKLAQERAEVVYEVRPFLNKKGTMPNAFFKMLVRMHDEGIADKIIENLKKAGNAIVPLTTLHAAEEQLRRLAK